MNDLNKLNEVKETNETNKINEIKEIANEVLRHSVLYFSCLKSPIYSVVYIPFKLEISKKALQKL